MLMQGSDIAADGEIGRRVDAMRRRIAELLEAGRGDGFLKKLFWDLLDYERVNQPVPLSVLPAEARDDVSEAIILARCGQTPVLYVPLTASELADKTERPIVRYVGNDTDSH